MKTLNGEQLKDIAADIFQRYPKANKVSVTVDGMAFITDESDLAVKNHSKKNRHGKELEISSYTREQFSEKSGDTGKQLNATELIEKINAAAKPDEVEEIKKAETSGKKRATVLAAADAKLAELNKK
jgi:hypothetical protein